MPKLICELEQGLIFDYKNLFRSVSSPYLSCDGRTGCSIEYAALSIVNEFDLWQAETNSGHMKTVS